MVERVSFAQQSSSCQARAPGLSFRAQAVFPRFVVRRSTHRRGDTARIAASSAAGGSSGNSAAAAPSGATIPQLLNAIPHDREVRRHFYSEVSQAAAAAVAAGEQRISLRCTIPELNTDFDVYRVGTQLELAREVATTLSADGKRVRVCVQQSLGQGVFAGMPLSLNGVGRLMSRMDWGPAADFISQGLKLGATEVDEADIFLLLAPQNIPGHSILPALEEMTQAAQEQGKPVLLLNPKLGDIQSAGGVMGVRGRQQRMDFAESFTPAYHFRLLYVGASMYPIMGGLRFSYGGQWEVFKRIQFGLREEEYRFIAAFDTQPGPRQITEAFQRSKQVS